MSYENWKDKAQGFQTVDVRHIQGSSFELSHDQSICIRPMIMFH